jgi:hypothetical protein
MINIINDQINQLKWYLLYIWATIDDTTV